MVRPDYFTKAKDYKKRADSQSRRWVSCTQGWVATQQHYMRLEHRREVDEVIDEGRKVRLFLSREVMIKYLLEMYDRARAGDVIRAQCVRCTDFTPEIKKKILEAAGGGVRFQMVINRHSPAAEEFRELFDPIEGAEVIDAQDNAISMQGLSYREVVIAVPGVESYTAVLVRDEYFVRIVKRWFDRYASEQGTLAC